MFPDGTLGQNDTGALDIFVRPDAAAKVHTSLTPAWRPLEWMPKRRKYEEWKWRLKFDGFYIPDAEPRPFKLIDPYTHTEIEETIPSIHQSVLDRIERTEDYQARQLASRIRSEPVAALMIRCQEWQSMVGDV